MSWTRYYVIDNIVVGNVLTFSFYSRMTSHTNRSSWISYDLVLKVKPDESNGEDQKLKWYFNDLSLLTIYILNFPIIFCDLSLQCVFPKQTILLTTQYMIEVLMQNEMVSRIYEFFVDNQIIINFYRFLILTN